MGFSTPPSSGGGTSGLFGSLLTGTPPTQASTGLTTVLTPGSATVANTAAGITISNASQPATQIGLLRTSVPSTPYKVRILNTMTSDGGSSAVMGIGWIDSVTGRVEYLMLSYGANNNGTFVLQQQSTFGNYYANLEFSYYGAYAKYPMWMQIGDDGTNVSYSYSTDGVNFQNIYTAAKAGSYLGTSGYNQIVWLSSLGGNIGGNQGGVFTASPSSATLMSWSIL